MKRVFLSFPLLAALAFSASAAVTGPFTTKNDDSCDVMLAPAATLLLPYFEVDPSAPTGTTTLFTIVNTTALPQIAHVTIWTDWAFPVLDFNILPPNPDHAVAGWLYFNLDNRSPQTPIDLPSQNWVISSMAAEGRYSTDMDAALLGNGCSALVAETSEGRGAPAIGPSANGVKTFATGSPTTLNNDDSCDIMVAPAATLLLPYFEVDVTSPTGQTTLFTVTNVTAFPQIAHVRTTSSRTSSSTTL